MRRVTTLMLLAIMPACAPVAERDVTERQVADIYWIDVDGGAATLIVTPAGESILIDSGENKDSHAARMHHVAAEVAGLKQIDHFIVTHFHGDHWGGTYKLSQLIPIKNIYDHGIVDNPEGVGDGYAELLSLHQKVTGGQSRTVKAGDTFSLKQSEGLPPVEMLSVASDRQVASSEGASEALNPLCAEKQDPPDRPEFAPSLPENAASIAVLFKYGNFRFLDTGDLTWNVEADLVCPSNLVGTVDLFQISHHGLDASNNTVFVHSIRPRVVVLNNAPRKGAEPVTMQTLKTSPDLETIWQMYRNVRTGPELNTGPEFIANKGSESGGEFIKATIQPDGAFSVQLGESGFSKQYVPKD